MGIVRGKCPRRDAFWVENARGGTARKGSVLVGELSGRKLSGGNCPGGNLPRTYDLFAISIYLSVIPTMFPSETLI